MEAVNIFGQNAIEEKGEMARMSSFVGAIAVGDLVKSTLGPKGMDKILVSQTSPDEIQVTNDGATILKAIHLDNPAAKVLVDIAKVQDDEVGDGTTSVCVLSAELLREAEKLVDQRVHPQVIAQGWRLAYDAASKALMESSQDHAADAKKFREDLVNIAKTTLSSKILAAEKNKFAEMAVEAVLRLKVAYFDVDDNDEQGNVNLDHIQIIKKLGGTMTDSFLADGFILDKRVGTGQPKRMTDCRILIANTPMDTDKIKLFGSRVRVDSTAKVAEIETAEKEKMKHKVEKILAHKINVFINRQLIYNYPEQMLADAHVMGIEHADFEGVERLALVTGGEIVSTFDHPEQVKLGTCQVIEEMMIGEDTVLHFKGCPATEACSIVLRGPTKHLLEEADRSLHDALCVLATTVRNSRIVYGGGASESLMAKAVDEVATKTPGKKALAIEIPMYLAMNAGYDGADLVSRLRSEHYNGQIRAGLDMRQGTVGNMEELGITESYRVKSHVLSSASEAAEMILRVRDDDDVVMRSVTPLLELLQERDSKVMSNML